MAGRAEQNGIAQRAAGKRVRCGIALSQIGFDFHDPTGPKLFTFSPQQHFAK
jgi:hypothetical protein